MKPISLRELNFWFFLANLLPKRLVCICAVKVIAYATTGYYSDTITPSLPAVKAIERYGKDHGIL
jgi:hypothetical protein